MPRSLDLPPNSPTSASGHIADTGPCPVLDVATLTRRMTAGDDMAYRSFHDAYLPRLSRYLLVVTAGNEEAMREALQETFRRVVKHIRVFRDETVFWSWLTVLARSALSDEGRKRRRYLAFLDRFTRHVATVETPSSTEEAGDGRLDASLTQNLASLPVDERELIEWKYFDRCSVSEIAARLQTPEGAVESRLVRIRRKLKAAVLAGLKNESTS
ncbi:MAG: sigma-70 family RNA polymerase sigma factor [Opitutaceae bacterium]